MKYRTKPSKDWEPKDFREAVLGLQYSTYYKCLELVREVLPDLSPEDQREYAEEALQDITVAVWRRPEWFDGQTNVSVKARTINRIFFCLKHVKDRLIKRAEQLKGQVDHDAIEQDDEAQYQASFQAPDASLTRTAVRPQHLPGVRQLFRKHPRQLLTALLHFFPNDVTRDDIDDAKNATGAALVPVRSVDDTWALIREHRHRHHEVDAAQWKAITAEILRGKRDFGSYDAEDVRRMVNTHERLLRPTREALAEHLKDKI
jgi:hypothetical protein